MTTLPAALIHPDAIKELIGMVRYEAGTWRDEPERERDPVEEAGFLDAIAKTLEALAARSIPEAGKAMDETAKYSLLRDAALDATRKCMAAWAAGEPAHRVKDMIDAIEKLQSLVDPLHMKARPALASVPAPSGANPVGIAGTMPGTDGFTMACFKASDVPVGTKLYVYADEERHDE